MRRALFRRTCENARVKLQVTQDIRFMKLHKANDVARRKISVKSVYREQRDPFLLPTVSGMYC